MLPRVQQLFDSIFDVPSPPVTARGGNGGGVVDLERYQRTLHLLVPRHGRLAPGRQAADRSDVNVVRLIQSPIELQPDIGVPGVAAAIELRYVEFKKATAVEARARFLHAQ